MLSPLTMDRFDGGMVDNYLNTDAPNKYALADNYLVDESGNLSVRWGTSISSARVPLEVGFSQVTGVYFFPDPFTEGLFVLGRRAYTIAGTYTEVPGYSSNGALAGKQEGAYEQGVYWRGQFIVAYSGQGSTTQTNTIPQRIYCTTLDTTYQAMTCGLPRMTKTIASTTGAGTNTYVYALHYYYTFTDWEGTQFVEQGPVIFYAPAACAAPDSSSIQLTSIPVLANTSNYSNYDTTNITIKIHRTTNAGTTYYLLGSITNGTTTYTDTAADSTIQSNTTLYTDGGRLEWTPPPQNSYYVTQVNDYFWYAGANFVTQTIQGVPGASPASYVQYTDQRVRGLSFVIGYPILFCDKSVYRIEGVYDEFGNSGFTLREISSTAGCLSNRGIVPVPGGLAWPGNGGFYFSDGFSVVRISEYLLSRYFGWANSSIVGAYDSQYNLVWWTIASKDVAVTAGLASSFSDSLAVWHVRYGVKPDAVFTTSSFRNNIFPSALCYSGSLDTPSTYRSRLLIGDARGYFLWMDPLRYTDPYIDVTIPPSSFRDTAILYDFQSAGLTESPAVRNYTTHVSLEAGTDTDISVQVMHRRDDTGAWQASPEMKQDLAVLWNISDATWSTPSVDYEWNGQRILEARRMIPSGQLRSQRRQVRFNNALTHISRSDDLGVVNVAAATFPTVTLTTAGQTWPTKPEEYYIAFETSPGSGSYGTPYLIRSRSSDTVITLYDPYQALGSVTGAKWQMTGYRKDERFQMLSYTLYYEKEGDTQSPSTTTVGANS